MERMLFLNDKHCGFPVESYEMKFKSELILCQNIFFASTQLFFNIRWNYLILCIYSWLQVHYLLCKELLKLVDRISRIFPEIEAARPRCSAGIQSLCVLNRAIEKAKLLLQYCSESSKLYLVCNLFNDQGQRK